MFLVHFVCDGHHGQDGHHVTEPGTLKSYEQSGNLIPVSFTHTRAQTNHGAAHCDYDSRLINTRCAVLACGQSFLCVSEAHYAHFPMWDHTLLVRELSLPVEW